MNHDDAARLMGAYLDGELDLSTCLALEGHLAGCAECRQKLAGQRELVDLVRAKAPRFTAPPFLKTRLLTQLRAEAPTETAPWWRRLAPAWATAGVAAVACLVVVSVFAIGGSGDRRVAQEAVANHVRSLQVTHLMDVASTDQHTVKPWFAGKLDYSPQVVDLGPSGYPLVGGRLDVLDHRDVAALVYQRRRHFINLFIWPAGDGTLHGHYYQDGYHVLLWTKSGMDYVAVSELGEKELKDFVQMIQEQTVDTRPGE